MALRKNTFLLKRSNVPGNVPTAGQIQLGELALNTSNVILYASGTTTNSILPIGWDRVARTGDTMTGNLFTPYLSATTVSATTYLNLPIKSSVTGFTYSNNTFTLTNNTGGTLSASINTVTGLTVNGTLLATTVSATTYLGLPIDVFTTGGTYNSSAGTITYNNTTGGTFTVSGFSTGSTADVQSSEFTGTITTTSTSYVDLTAVSLTTKNLGGVGTYMVAFDCYTTISVQSASIYYQLVIDGVAVASSERRVNQYASNSATLAYMSVASSTLKSALASGKIIKVQWKVTSGTGSVYAGSLRINGRLTSSIL